MNDIVSNSYFWGILSLSELFIYLKVALTEIREKFYLNSSQDKILSFIRILITLLSFLAYFFNYVVKNPLYSVSIIQALIIMVYAVTLKLSYIAKTKTE